MRRIAAAIVVVVSMSAAGAPAAADDPSLATVLQRAASYVADFHRQLASIVAEERYIQDWKVVARHEARPVSHRVLLGDLLLVKPGPDASWIEFRDVFEVDGYPVRERDRRLERMFLTPSQSTTEQIGKILTESARFNIGDISRNVNTPLFPLVFLEAANHYRFKFKQTRDRQPGVAAVTPAAVDGAFRVATEVWVVAYDEKEPGTMIRTTMNRDLPSHGRFWIEPASGRVLMSELIADNRSVRATIDVSYQSAPLLGLLVPIEMRERYEGKRTGSLVEGRATYGKFRQFTVNTDEQFLLKK